MDANSGSSQNFFSVTAGIAFALFAACRGIETLHLFRGKDEDFKHLSAVSIHAGLSMAASLVPLAVSDTGSNVRLCSYVVGVYGAVAFGLMCRDLWTGRIQFVFKKLSLGLMAIAVVSLVAMFVNAIWMQSSDLYKALVLCILMVLCLRFHLVVGVVMGFGSR